MSNDSNLISKHEHLFFPPSLFESGKKIICVTKLSEPWQRMVYVNKLIMNRALFNCWSNYAAQVGLDHQCISQLFYEMSHSKNTMEFTSFFKGNR